MKRLCFALLVSLVLNVGARADPADAVVRLSSHGASATVIETAPGRTLLLGCAHAFEGEAVRRKIVLDVPTPISATTVKHHPVRLIALDVDSDLSLLLLEDGPLPYVCPVAPPRHVPDLVLLSVGYDGMRWPATQVPATRVGSASSTTYTRERPGHGRSGGALIDPGAGVLIGVVQGYEVDGRQRGMYVSHTTILSFLARHRPGTPAVREEREFARPPLAIPRTPSIPSCPDGRCPLLPR
jgi:hypothetical protein